MKIKRFSKKDKFAEIKVDSLEDLYYLKKIIEKGDTLGSKSARKIKIGAEGEKARAAKVTIYVRIEVDKVEYSHGNLRCSGKVVSEHEDIPQGSYHSLELTVGSLVKLEKKEWKEYQIARLKDAEKASVMPKAIVCVLDDSESNIGILTGAGLKPLSKIELGLAKKRLKEDTKRDKLGELAQEILDLDSRYNTEYIVFGSPLFWKEELLKAVKNKDVKIAKKVKLADVSTGSKKGLDEVMSAGSLDKVLKESRLKKELELVERILEEISKDSGLVAYGLKEVKESANSGAVETLVLVDKYMDELKEKDEFENVEKLIDKVEKSGGKVMIIAYEHAGGKKIQGLGGIAALLRFKFK
jgi:protein pelota